MGIPEVKADDWSKLFSLLSNQTKSGRVILIFDEISWMGSEAPDFLGKLKTAWDEEFKKNPKLILILCGSVTTWIEKNILNSTAFFGRISWSISLRPLPLSDCNKLLEAQGFRGSVYEKYKILAVTGGIPWYLEQIQGQYNADENIKRQCFTKGGIFVEIFGKGDKIYKNIVKVLAKGPMTYQELVQAGNYPSSGRLTEYLNNLVSAGFISKDYTWSLKSGEESRYYQIRLSDNYLRFYLKYIKPKLRLIDNERYRDVSLSSLPAWETTLSLQFENLVLSNRNQVLELLNIRPEDVIVDNPFLQKKTSKKEGCQIDYLIQTKYNNLYLCEIKFSRKPIGSKVIQEVRNKIDSLELSKKTAILPILIHVNGISESLKSEDFFYKIIDFGKFLKKA